MVALAALSLALALLACPCAAQEAQQPQGFIRVASGRFVDDACQEFAFSGWNGWGLIDHALSDPASITARFKQANAASLNMMRFFVTGEGGGLLSWPGQLNERAARGLDFVLAEAAKHGIKLTLALTNQWKEDGVEQWEQWCGTSGTSVKPRPDIDVRQEAALNATERAMTPYTWLLSPECKDQVKQFFTALVNRRNTITGLLYRDDATIFSWNVMNEPRCKYCGPEAVDSWYGELADHLKSVDPNHLITTGEEGFFDERDPMAAYDPNDGNQWGPRSGQDFRANHAHPSIDYAVMHLWPDNWGRLGIDFGQGWLDAHIKVAAELGKPLILEEFGKGAAEGDILSTRDPWFELVKNAVDSSLQSDGPLRGSLFWQWDGDAGPRPGVGSAIREYDSTFKNHIKPFARKVAAASGQLVPGCTPRTSAPAPAPGADSATERNGTQSPPPKQARVSSSNEGSKASDASSAFFQDAQPAGRKLLQGR